MPALGPAAYAANDGFTVGAFQVRGEVAIPEPRARHRS